MTAAHRFKGWGWLLTCVVVALGCYMVSLQVAAERRKLVQADAQVRQAQADIRRLETEFDARSSMAQLEKWNGDSFRYAAPRADQYVTSTAELAALDPSKPDVTAAGAKVELASAVVPGSIVAATDPVVAQIVPAPKPAVAVVGVHPAPRHRPETPDLGRAVMAAVATVPTRVLEHRPQVAMLDHKLLSDATLGDLRLAARQESRTR